MSADKGGRRPAGPADGRRRVVTLATATAAVVLAAGLGLTQLPSGEDGDGSRDASGDRRASAGDGPAGERGGRSAEEDGPLGEEAASRLARERGEPVEATALHTPSTTTLALPDGTYLYRSHASAIRAEAGGKWRDIDTTLRRTDEGTWAATAVNHPVEFSGGSEAEAAARASRAGGFRDGGPHDGPYDGLRPASFTAADGGNGFATLATLATGGHEITLSWPGTLPAPVVEHDRALYEEVFPGVDLLLTARDAGFSHVLILTTPEAAAAPELASVSYRLSSPGLTFSLDPASGVVHAKDGDGDEVAAIPSPYMWDSAGEPAVTAGPEPAPPALPGEPDPAPAPGEEPPEEPEDAIDDDAPPPVPEDQQGPGTQLGGRAQAPAAAGSLELPGLAGPQPGSHDAIAGIGLATDGALTLTPDTALLTDEDTVYPVFLDPSPGPADYKGHTDNWTVVYAKHENDSFWNGQNFNDGTAEARVGWESDTGGLSRSFFQLDWSRNRFDGAHIKGAGFYALETYSWSCTPRSVEMWRTGNITANTTWNNQPQWEEEISSQSVAHGYSGACPDEWIRFPAVALVEEAIDSNRAKVHLGLRATSEEAAMSWKKFRTNGYNSPVLQVNYNHKPEEPTGLDTDPGQDCDIEGASSIGKSDVTLSATAEDDDGDLTELQFQLWQHGHGDDKILDENVTVNAAGHSSVTVGKEELTDGTRYWWRVRALDNDGAASTFAPPGGDNCGFVYDSSRPNSPRAVSEDFPEAAGDGSVWSAVKFGTEGDFTFTPDGSEDTVRYEYSFNRPSYDRGYNVSAGSSVTLSLSPPLAGPNALYMKAEDGAGNVSARSVYFFYVTPKAEADAPGDTTGDGYPDLFVIDHLGNLRLHPSHGGDIRHHLAAAHDRGRAVPDGYWTDENGTPALLTHNGDFLPGDGLTDLLARMPGPDGGLYLYRGDGYGSVDVSRRTEVLLPQGGPAAADLTQILAVGDITGDGRPDVFATTADQFWAFTGYTGGAFAEALELTLPGAWATRDLVTVADVSGDGVADLLFRKLGSGLMYLREGIAAPGGGTDIGSLAKAGSSAQGGDAEYGAGWTATEHPLVLGTPDADGDGIPDIWATAADGSGELHYGTRNATGAVTTFFAGGWDEDKAFG